MADAQYIPAGTCQCGCGRTTGVANGTSTRDGTVKGQHFRYVKGHNQRGAQCARGCTCDKHSASASERARMVAAKHHPGPQAPPVESKVLQEMYCGKSLDDVGLMLGVSSTTVLRWMEFYGLPRRSPGAPSHYLSDRVNEPTDIEVAVQAELDKLGIEWASGEKVKSFRPDLILPGYNAVVEVQGCYWHGCIWCYPKLSSQQATQKQRDRVKRRVYEVEGYVYMLVWEHSILRDSAVAVRKMLYG